MGSEENFQENIELWSHKNPKEAIWLEYLQPKNIELCQDSNGFLNLRNTSQEGDGFFYPNNPLEEAERWRKNVDLSEAEVLYVYGIGLGYYYFSLKEWLKENENRHVIFLEDDLEVIAKFFETDHARQLLQDTQTSLYFFKDGAESGAFFNQLYWNFPMAKISFAALNYYERNKQQKYQDLHHQISYDAAVNNSNVKEYLECGIVLFKNYYTNILQINEASLGNALFGQFPNIPAIICGAGPSLKKNISLLKEVGNKAIIFAGSSALNALAAEGIRPHLGAGIDPNPMQEQRLKQIPRLDFPFLYRNRLYPPALKLALGQKFYITGAGGYEIAEYFENKFGIEGKTIEEGRNVVNFCLEAAYEMGCNPIIFAGMDLAYTGMESYTSGVVQNPSISSEGLLKTSDFNEEAIIRTDIEGNPIYTLWKWIAEAKWIGDFAAQHPEITIINATEGGLGFPGVPNIPLREVIQKCLSKDHSIKEAIDAAASSHSLSKISKEAIVQAMNELENSLERSLSCFQILMEENSKLIAELEANKSIERSQTARAALAETELADELAFNHVIKIFNDIASQLMVRDLMKLFDPHSTLSEYEKELEKLNLNQQKYRYLNHVAQINLQLLKNALEQRRS